MNKWWAIIAVINLININLSFLFTQQQQNLLQQQEQARQSLYQQSFLQRQEQARQPLYQQSRTSYAEIKKVQPPRPTLVQPLKGSPFPSPVTRPLQSVKPLPSPAAASLYVK
jgi:hypothetical protein